MAENRLAHGNIVFDTIADEVTSKAEQESASTAV